MCQNNTNINIGFVGTQTGRLAEKKPGKLGTISDLGWVDCGTTYMSMCAHTSPTP